jgi:hypothetical protein
MNREEFFKLAGEWPEDIIGDNWEEDIDSWLAEYQCDYCGGIAGGSGEKNDACVYCKMD